MARTGCERIGQHWCEKRGHGYDCDDAFGCLGDGRATAFASAATEVVPPVPCSTTDRSRLTSSRLANQTTGPHFDNYDGHAMRELLDGPTEPFCLKVLAPNLSG